MNILLLINEHSGTVAAIGADAIEHTATMIAGEHHNLETVCGAWNDLQAAAARAQDDTIIACAGGDGTQATIAGAIANTGKTLIPLPCGTVNLLCRDLDIPLDIDEALQACLSGKKTKIDVGWAGERPFINNVVFGAYAEMAEAREDLRDADNLEEVSFSLVNAANALFHADPIKFNVSLDGDKFSMLSNTIALYNNAITGANKLIPYRENISNGELVAYLTSAQHGGDFTRLLVNFAMGSLEDLNHVDVKTCRKARVSSPSGKYSFSIDGDPMETEDAVDVTIQPGALNVLVPSS